VQGNDSRWDIADSNLPLASAVPHQPQSLFPQNLKKLLVRGRTKYDAAISFGQFLSSNEQCMLVVSILAPASSPEL
jgi:hypothetical protein